MNEIETCFSPKLFPAFEKKDRIIVIADIFRATTSICAALNSGAKEILAVSDKSECLKYKEQGYLIAGERLGKKLDYADIGNSPDIFSSLLIKDKSIVLNSTNGTRTIRIASEEDNHVVIGAFVNLKALTEYLLASNKHILIFCSGWKGHFSLEDSLFAGALAHEIIYYDSSRFHTRCDATLAAMDLWQTARINPRKYIEKASHRQRLKHMKLDHVIDYCMKLSVVDVVPVLENNKIVKLKNN